MVEALSSPNTGLPYTSPVIPFHTSALLPLSTPEVATVSNLLYILADVFHDPVLCDVNMTSGPRHNV